MQESAPSHTTPLTRSLRILLVEDNLINQRLATALLRRWGHSVVLAENGQIAVDLFPTEVWDVVLMDLQMPVMGGLEATALIRALEPAGRHTPIIAVTANTQDTDRLACQAAGMDDFLAKPYSQGGMQEMLAHYCPAPAAPA